MLHATSSPVLLVGRLPALLLPALRDVTVTFDKDDISRSNLTTNKYLR